jgi:predicted metal-dependent peptidase
MTPEEKLIRAKIQIYRTSPFFSYIMLHLNLVEDKDNTILPMPTMGVDMKGNIFWNRAFVDRQSNDELMGVLVHEVAHRVLNHLERLGGRIPMLFNISNDIVINNLLIQQGFKLPKEGLKPNYHSIKIFGIVIQNINEKNSEMVYDELLQEAQNHMQELQGMQFDNHFYGDNNNGDEKETEQEKFDRQQGWKKILAEASQFAKQRGNLPADLERYVEDILDAKIDWRSLLFQMVSSQIPFDFTYSYPSRRSAGVGFFMPKMSKECVEIVGTLDTSGSINREDLTAFISELYGIKNTFQNVKIRLIVCDAEVHEDYEIDNNNFDDLVSLSYSGGGGTSHVKSNFYISEKYPDCHLVLHFTDGYTDFGEKPEGFEVIWVLTKHSSADVPYGRIVKIE